MSLLGGSTPGFGTNTSMVVLDVLFNNSAVLLKDPSLLANNGLVGKVMAFASDLLGGSSLPLLGFTYRSPKHIEYLSYTYSEYPFLNQKLVSNSFIKNPTTIEIEALRPITRVNSWLLNFINTKTIIQTMEAYADAGGLFKLFTRWGTIDDLALLGLTFNTEGGSNDPGIFTMKFKKLQFIESEEQTAIDKMMDVISTGAGVVGAVGAVVTKVGNVI